MATSPPRPTAPRENILARGFDLLIAATNAVGTIWIFVIMVLLNTDVFMRFLFNAPVRGVPLIISLSIIAIVFLQMPDALRHGRFTRSDVLIGRLLKSKPVIGHTMQMIYNVAGIVLMVILCWYTWPFFQKDWVEKTYAGNEGDFTVPMWPMLLMVLIGSAACGIQYARHTWHDIKFLRGDHTTTEADEAGGTFQ
jgi:TRAP-type mannitol/chloroaromatic compound transport system permease small subunit